MLVCVEILKLQLRPRCFHDIANDAVILLICLCSAVSSDFAFLASVRYISGLHAAAELFRLSFLLFAALSNALSGSLLNAPVFQSDL